MPLLWLSKDNKTECVTVAGIETAFIIRHFPNGNGTKPVLEHWTTDGAAASVQFNYVHQNGEFAVLD